MLFRSYNCTITVVSRSDKNFGSFKGLKNLSLGLLENLNSIVKEQSFDIVIQASPNGMGGKSLFSWPQSLFKKDCLYIESVSSPRWTEFLKGALKSGASYITGKQIFYTQAYAQFLWWESLGHFKKSNLVPEAV